MASTHACLPQSLPLTRAVDEFVLTTVLLFLAVTVVLCIRHPDSPIYIANLYYALPAIGVLSGAILTGLIFTPPGRRSGGHMNPAVTVTLWLMDVFPGRSVVPYVLAQVAGSVVGTGLARLIYGRAIGVPSVMFGVIRHLPTWRPERVFLAEAGGMLILVLVVGYLLARPSFAIVVPFSIGIYVALVIAFLGPRSGGSINPARQFGPAVLSGQTLDLWIYLVAPIVGAALGSAVQTTLIQRFHARPPLTYKMYGCD